MLSTRSETAAATGLMVLRQSSIRACFDDGNVNLDRGALLRSEETTAAVEAVAAEVRAALPAPGSPPEDRDLLAELHDAAHRAEQLSSVETTKEHETFLSATAVLRSGLPLVIMNDRPAPGGGGQAVRTGRSDPRPLRCPPAARPWWSRSTGATRRLRPWRTCWRPAGTRSPRSAAAWRTCVATWRSGCCTWTRTVRRTGPLRTSMRTAPNSATPATLQTATEVELQEAWFDAHQDELQTGDLVISIDASRGASPDVVKVAVTESS